MEEPGRPSEAAATGVGKALDEPDGPAGAGSASARLRRVPLEVLRDTPLKDLGSLQLAQVLRHEARATMHMDSETVSSSVTLASILHSAQKRGSRGMFTETPYIEHPLRNAVRLLRWGCRDQDVIVAAVLHDTIEDGAQQFVRKVARAGRPVPESEARQRLSDYIESAYGSRVLMLVEAVTNDYMTDTQRSEMTVDEHDRHYREHVRQTVQGHPDAFLVKVSDFVDNAAGLVHNDTPGHEEFVLRRARKYLPVVAVFEEAMAHMNLPVADGSEAAIAAHLAATRDRLEHIMEKYRGRHDAAPPDVAERP